MNYSTLNYIDVVLDFREYSKEKPPDTDNVLLFCGNWCENQYPVGFTSIQYPKQKEWLDKTLEKDPDLYKWWCIIDEKDIERIMDAS